MSNGPNIVTGDLDLVIGHIWDTIGIDPSKWTDPPVGYPHEVEAALLDSVFSLQARYGQAGDVRRPATGAYKVVANWRAHIGDRPMNSLGVFLADVDAPRCGGPARLPEVLGSRQVAVPSAVDKPTKAQAVYDVAAALFNGMRIDTADDVRLAVRERQREMVKAIKSVRGVGPAATTYFLMNLKIPGVKVDTMVHRFVRSALNRKVRLAEAGELVTKAAELLQADLLHLDRSIWKHESDTARKR